MTRAIQFHGKITLFFCSGVALGVILAAPFFVQSAFAQEAPMRSSIDPESPLAKSQLKKLKRKSALDNSSNVASTSPLEKYKLETVSDADIEAENLRRLFGEESTETEDAAKPEIKPKSLSEIEGEADDLEAANPKDANQKPQSGKKPSAKSSKKIAATNGKTTIDPGLDVQTTGTLVVRKGQKAQMLRAQKVVPQEAVQSRDLTEAENPFRAVGIRVGSITLRPALEQGVEVTSNRTASAGGEAATSSVTTLRLDGISDWRNGSLETNGFLTLRKAFKGDSEFDPEAGASIKMTHPILRDWGYTIGAAYGLKRESAVSGSAFPTTITKRPLAQDMRLSLGVGKSEGALQPSIKLELGRLTYGDATGSTGSAISQSDRDQTTLRGTFRLGAEISPALTPFVEVAYGKTWRDESVDVFGNDRSSTDMRASVGAEINISEKLNGEFSVGWLRQSFGTSSLGDIDGVALAAALMRSLPKRVTLGLSQTGCC